MGLRGLVNTSCHREPYIVGLSFCQSQKELPYGFGYLKTAIRHKMDSGRIHGMLAMDCRLGGKGLRPTKNTGDTLSDICPSPFLYPTQRGSKKREARMSYLRQSKMRQSGAFVYGDFRGQSPRHEKEKPTSLWRAQQSGSTYRHKGYSDSWNVETRNSSENNSSSLWCSPNDDQQNKSRRKVGTPKARLNLKG